MATPASRTPVRIARGTYANLNASILDLEEGEICYATDQNAIYVVEAGVLTPISIAETNVNADYIREVIGIDQTGEPLGHKDRSESTISFNTGTRTFTIQPASASFDVWCKGIKYTKTSAETVTIPNTTGIYYIYYSNSGVLSYKTTYFDWANDTPTAYIYWNATTGAAPYFADERHGIVLDWATHEYLHRTRGAVFASGFSVSNYTLSGDGSADSHAQIDLGGGTFFDEDLEVIITHSNSPTANTWQQDLQGPAQIPVLYLSGTAWVRDAATNFPLKAGTAYPRYNLLSSGTWSATEAAANKFLVQYLVATHNLGAPVMAIMGQAVYDNIGAAEAAVFDDLVLTNFPSVEFRPLYKLVFQTGSYGNAIGARLRNILDLRNITATGGGTGVSDHGILTGLADDDHLQYIHITDTRAGISANISTSGTLGTTNSTASSNSSTGALTVTGGVGIGGDVNIAGNLTVNGTTTNINTQNLTVEDKNIIIGDVTTPTDTTADGGGITLKGTTDKTINWVDSTDAWTFSEHVSIANGKEYRIDGTKVLDGTSLGSGVTGSSLTSVGTIGTGVWQGSVINKAYLDSTLVSTGDTGTVTSAMIADGTIVDADISASAEIAVSKLADGAARQLLQTDAAGTGVEWASNIDIPGTLDVTSAATFDSSVAVTGALTKSGNNVVTVGDSGTVTSTMIADGTIVDGDINASAAIADTKLATISTAGKVSNSATTATSANTASAIVARDASGNFSAGTITANLSGNASTVTTNANLTGDVTSVGNATSIAAGVIVDADVNASAAIAGTKISPDFGSQTIATTGIVSHALGTAGAPTVTFTGDTNTGIYSPGADQVAISTGGTGRLFVDSTGRVGIGTSSISTISEKVLHIYAGAGASSGLRLTGNAGTGLDLIQGTDGSGYLYQRDNAFLAIGTNNTERLRITSAGLVGVGTSSPTANSQIEVAKNSSTAWAANTVDDIYRAYNSNTSTNNSSAIYGAYCNYGDGTFTGARFGAVSTGSYSAAFVTALRDSDGVYKERLRIDSSGRVGIGTQSPSTALEITNGKIQVNTGSSLGSAGSEAINTYSSTGSRIRFYDNSNSCSIGSVQNGVNSELTFNVNGTTERVRIDSVGRVGIGTSSPGYALDVVAGTGSAIAARLRGNGSGNNNTQLRFYGSNAATDQWAIGNAVATNDATRNFDVFDIVANANRLRIDSSGNVGIGTTSPAQKCVIEDSGDVRLRVLKTGTAVLDIGVSGSTSFVRSDAEMSFRVAGSETERMRIDTSGRVGIGTSSPGNFVGNVNIVVGSAATSTTTGAVTVYSGTGTYGGLYFADGTVGDQLYRGYVEYKHDVDALTLGSGGSERARIDSSGRLLINSTAARTNLDPSGNTAPIVQIEGTTTNTSNLAIIRNVAGVGNPVINLAKTRSASNGGVTAVIADDVLGAINFQGSEGTGFARAAQVLGEVDGAVATGSVAGRLTFTTAPASSGVPTERMRIDSSGNVGIGTGSPGVRLQVTTASGGEAMRITNAANSGRLHFQSGSTSEMSSQNSDLIVGCYDPYNLRFTTGNTERARIDTSGRLLSGTSSAGTNYYIGGAANTPQIQLQGSTNSAASMVIHNIAGSGTSGGSNAGRLHLVGGALGTSANSTNLTSNDIVGSVVFSALVDGSLNIARNTAQIQSLTDGIPTTTDSSASLRFFTTAAGAVTSNEGFRITSDKVHCYNQAAPTSKSAAATLTIDELKTGIIQYTGAAATLTLPTGTLSEGGFVGIYTNMTFEWSVINTGSGTCTIGAGTAHTIVGAATITAGASGRFASRRTASNTFVSYRIA